MIFPILFQDQNYIVIDKPSGVLTVPPRMEDGRPILGRELEKSLNCQIFPVHRLDYEVSGIVLFALNSRAHQDANLWFEKKRVKKTYQALTEGPTLEHLPVKDQRYHLKVPHVDEQFIWKSFLLKGKKRTYHHPQGKPSLTQGRYLGANIEGLHRWELEPVTGRSHQLRYELSVHGFPIRGDQLYGSKTHLGARIELRAQKLTFLDQQLPDLEIPSLF